MSVIPATCEVQAERYRIFLSALKLVRIDTYLPLCASALNVVYPIQMTFVSLTSQTPCAPAHLMVVTQSIWHANIFLRKGSLTTQCNDNCSTHGPL